MTEVSNSTSEINLRGHHSEDEQTIDCVHQAGHESDYSDANCVEIDKFYTKAAFLLTPSHDLSLDRAATICDRMPFRGKFSVTKTATGILFKFSNADDCMAILRKGFHRVTGGRLYKKVSIPCRPQRVYSASVLNVPLDVPLEDICHCLDRMRFVSVLEVRRPTTGFKHGPVFGTRLVDSGTGGTIASGPPIRVSFASINEYQALIQCGLDFYGATCFAVEPTPSAAQEPKTPEKTKH